MTLRLGYPFVLMLLIFAGACNRSEITRLRLENDSLRRELNPDYVIMASFRDIHSLFDSIDRNRNVVMDELEHGAGGEQLAARLRDINRYVKTSDEKIRTIQDELKSSRHQSAEYLALVVTLKDEMQVRLAHIANLTEQISEYRSENAGLEEKKRNTTTEAERLNGQLSSKQEELLLLESRVDAMLKSFRNAKADDCYTRARAMEETASRTKFAPEKRRDAYREALELYKIALSLGKEEARVEINKLSEKLDLK